MSRYVYLLINNVSGKFEWSKIIRKGVHICPTFILASVQNYPLGCYPVQQLQPGRSVQPGQNTRLTCKTGAIMGHDGANMDGV